MVEHQHCVREAIITNIDKLFVYSCIHMWEYAPKTIIYSGLIYTGVLITSYYERRGSWTQGMLQTNVENRRQRQQPKSALCVYFSRNSAGAILSME